ncbi:hypothetical protein BDZ89DRAFT_995144 [Hymenopellis radicata]|nr:hypothetical protein BDZ89DRAFT_995144 [Hymenopellis radicata]
MKSESAPSTSHGTSTFLSLPTELLENIILLSTLPPQNGPRSITAMAQTCHLVRSLIYNTVDSHLWREIFLATFDDPRAFATKLGLADHTPHDWEAEYKDRMGTPGVLALVSATLDAPPNPPYEHIETDGHVPLPRPQRTAACANSVWIDSVFIRDNPLLEAQYRSSPRLQWLYGPRYMEENSRRLAKVIVYDMRYLTPNRCWGPFMPLEEEEEITPNPAAALEIYGIRLQPSDLDVDDIDDSDYVASDTESNTDVQGDDNEDGSVIVPPGIHPLLLLQHLQPGPEGPTGAVYPTFPHNIVPDYTWLAAARLLIEENITERAFVVFPEPNDERQFLAELKALRGLEVLRMGGAPGYWEGATKWNNVTGEDSKEKDDGWDWAGVEGEYRRVVCWMDYRQLLLHNLQGPAAASSAAARYSRETIRVFPMHLHVSGYLPPPDAPPDFDKLSPQDQLVYILPIIEVEGNSTGSDMDEAAERRIWGTVRLIGGGIVRWTLTSAEPDTDDPEWITESVQMGQAGSAMGFMGLWTGALHEKTDPVGPCWAWKVN